MSFFISAFLWKCCPDYMKDVILGEKATNAKTKSAFCKATIWVQQFGAFICLVLVLLVTWNTRLFSSFCTDVKARGIFHQIMEVTHEAIMMVRMKNASVTWDCSNDDLEAQCKADKAKDNMLSEKKIENQPPSHYTTIGYKIQLNVVGGTW